MFDSSDKRCKVCRNRMANSLVCLRCGSDYTLVYAVERGAMAQLADAAFFLYQEEYPKALKALQSMQRLKRNPSLDALQHYLQDYIRRYDP